VTKREWQIEMANRFAKRDKAEELIDAQNTIRQLAAKLECYERLADASEMASNPMGVKSREALKNVREMKTIMTKEEEILRAEQEWDELSIRHTEALKKSMKKTNDDYWDSKKEELKGYSLAEQEYIKAMVTSIAGARLAGFNKKEKNT
jgi:hypothetical protein